MHVLPFPNIAYISPMSIRIHCILSKHRISLSTAMNLSKVIQAAAATKNLPTGIWFLEALVARLINSNCLIGPVVLSLSELECSSGRCYHWYIMVIAILVLVWSRDRQVGHSPNSGFNGEYFHIGYLC